jgi:hypothetical protein
MEQSIAQVLPDGRLALPSEFRDLLEEVQGFIVRQQNDVLILLPILEDDEDADKTASELLQAMREEIGREGRADRSLAEIIEEMRAVRKKIWEERFRPHYAESLD